MQRRSRDATHPSNISFRRPSIHSAPIPYLQSSLSSTTLIRAFSTSYPFAAKNPYNIHKKGHTLTNEEDEIEARMPTLRQDNSHDRSMLLRTIIDGLAKAPLPPGLAAVRQKYGLVGQAYHTYWQRVAEARLQRGGPTGRAKFAHLKAQRKLQQTSGRKDLNHFDLMIEAQEIDDKIRREARAEGIEGAKRIASNQRDVRAQSADTLKGLLEEAKIPLESDRAIKEIESKIESLRRQLDQLTYAKTRPPVPATQAARSAGLPIAAHPNAVEDEKPKTKRARWRESKKAFHLEEKITSPVKSLLNTYNSQVETIREQAHQLEEIRQRKEETLTKKRALLKQLEEQEKAENDAKMVNRSRKEAASFDLGDILDDAMGKVGNATRAPRTQSRVSQEEDNAPQIKPAEDSIALLRKVGVGSVSVVKKPTARSPVAESTDHARADPTMESLSTPAPLDPTKDTHSAVEHSAATNELSRSPFASANKPTPIPPNWPLSQKPSKEIQTLKQGNMSPVSPSDRKITDSLRLHVSPAGFIPIDEDLVVSIDASVPALQSQVFQMQQRLKSSYPRIDTLPYDVWTSENKRTLQTWLKILVSRWQTRFDDVEKTGQVDKGLVDERVREILDQMVRDHDLSNEAAERMAVRWHEVFDQKGAMGGNAEGVLDWDEFHAGGMGFLTEEAEHESPQVQHQQEEGKTMPFTGTNKRPTNDTATHESITRRLYSTSSRPPFDPALTPSSNVESGTATSSNSFPHTQLSLPHLTASGSAHMVSVSAKVHTVRTAIAVGTVYFTNPTPLSLIRSNSLKKGDVLGVSRIAGIMAAKKCPELIPLCHPIPLTHVGVELHVFGPDDPKSASSINGDMRFGGVMVEAKVQCSGPTGVEMEALTAVMGATLSIVDMCKAVDKFQRVQDVRVVLKEGGKSGTWKEEGWRSFQA
jgi:molybdenum cofactor biosynthesis protein MoaC